jgi:predicted nucleotidyltransferase
VPTIDERVAELLADRPRPGIASVYVFGSRAEGREHRESDLDLAVLLSWDAHATPLRRFEERLALIALFTGALPGADVDLVVLNDAPPSLGRRIVTNGRRIFCADAETDHAFVRDVQLRAADLAPFLARTRRIKLAALGR